MAWRVITPKKLNVAAMRQAIIDQMNEVAQGIEQDFDKTTESWERDVKFDSSVETQGNVVRAEVSTDDKVYALVNAGSPPHYISAVNARALAYPSTYRSKTEPRMIGSRGGGKSGSVVLAKEVWHPGFNAREFDKAVADKWQKGFQKKMVQAMKKAAKASGHSL